MKNANQQLFDRALKSIPGGVNSPVRAFKAVGGAPVFIERAQGPLIYDTDGNPYIDYVGSWGPMILGHADSEVVAAVREAAARGLSFGTPTTMETELAELVCASVASVEQVRMVNSGTEATMSAIRLARGFTGRDKVIKFEGCYHGHADGLLVKAGSGALTLGVPTSPGVPASMAEHTLTLEYNNLEQVAEAFAAFGDQLAAVIVEPVVGNMGCVLPSEPFLRELQQQTREHAALLIYDEVMTGFRISKGGAAEYYSVDADLFTFGKVIGGGLPIGAYGGRKELMEQVAPSGPIYQAGTLSGNPVAVTAGIETLQRLTPKSYEKLEELGSYFEEQLQTLIDTYDYPICQNRVGSMFSLFFHSGPIRNTQDVAKCNFQDFKLFFHTLLASGIYIAPSQYEAGFISLAHTKEILDKTIAQFNIALKDVFVHA